MDDMKQTIIPKSDQLNADDLISGPMTITITGVTIRGGQEQPVAISFEGDNGKPYKACKSMCRVMVTAWGPDSKRYVGRSMTLYRDADVKWAGMKVGGIRISHMSNIESALTMALTETRQSRKPFTVKPLASGAQPKAAQEPGSSVSTGSSLHDAPTPGAAPTDETIISDVDKLISARKFQTAADTASLIADEGKRDLTLERIAKAYKEVKA